MRFHHRSTQETSNFFAVLVYDDASNDMNKKFLDELRAFPKGKHDDQVDGGSLGFNKLSSGGNWEVIQRPTR